MLVLLQLDAMSMHWNPAKYAFVDDQVGVAVVTPWLKSLIPDIDLSYLSGYTKRNINEAFAFALRYFTLGEISLQIIQVILWVLLTQMS